ncbi:MAG: DUF423 domain-containing protein [Chlamydiales bacterium]|nr:DUF423 domain-containing protein [Chlamydiales bacterium]
MPQKTLLGFAALLGFLAVAAGAFGSHALKGRLTPEMTNLYEVAVRYQLIHALAAVVAAVAFASFHNGFMVGAGWLFIIGSVFFSGSLFLYIFTDLKQWAMLTPVGGVLLLGGWLALVIGAWRS